MAKLTCFSDYFMCSLFVYALEKLGHCHPSPRQATTIGVFSSHDGNIVGGALLGVGMALSGACPGTVLAQVGVGISSGFYALDGALLAGLVWTSLLKPWLQKSCNRPKSISFYSSETPEKKPLPLTIHERINVPRGALLLAFEGLCAAAVGATIYFGPVPNAKISPVLGGLLIGLSQFWSLLTRKTLLGASTAYEEAGALALWLLRNAPSPTSPNTHSSKQPHMGLKNILFATSMAAGAWAIGKLVPSLIEGAAVPLHSAFALSGGFLMVLGARIAGGCTSGHGISGMSIFSVSSFITIGTALVVGTLTRSAVVRAFV